MTKHEEVIEVKPAIFDQNGYLYKVKSEGEVFLIAIQRENKN